MTDKKEGANTKSDISRDETSPEYVKTHQENADYGYYLYPHRTPGKVAEDDPSLTGAVRRAGIWGFFNYRPKYHMNCLYFVQWCFEKGAPLQLLLKAMKSHGCPVEMDRHVHCEPCRMRTSAGFDSISNQIVICENNIMSKSASCNALAHEMLHAFDKCRAKFDVTNPEHVACTEIRAANLFHCNLGNAYIDGEARPWDIKLRHENCVRHKAFISLSLMANLTPQEAEKVIDKVFKRCYNDLEPFGRRLRHWTGDVQRATEEGVLYGYIETK